MSKKQIFGILIALVLTGTLYMLPKVVVENEDRQETAVAQPPVATKNLAAGEESHDEHEGHDHGPGMHGAELSSQDRQFADRLVENLKKSESKEKSAIFADSLAVLYARAHQYDSAAYYAEQALTSEKTLGRLASAGNYYLEAFHFAVDAGQQQAYSKKAEEYLQQVLQQDPKRLDVKSKLAMIYVSSPAPMKGIKMLQEVLEEDPDNAEALFNMGMLSVQSSQFEKAVERFEKFTKLKPENTQAQFYLAYSYLKLGKKAEAKAGFEKVKELDQSPEVQAAVNEHLKEL